MTCTFGYIGFPLLNAKVKFSLIFCFSSGKIIVDYKSKV